jgi:hypothetical protein
MRSAMMSFKGNKLIFYGHVVTLMHKIDKIVEIPQGLLVLTEFSSWKNDRNAYLVGRDGVVKWQIEQVGTDPKAGPQPYTGIGIDKDGNIHAHNWAGFACLIDIETGKIISKKMVK